MRRTALLICCVFGLAFAGCSGPSDSGPQSTVTPADRPAIPTETSDDPLEDVTRQTIETPTPAPTARPNATFEGVKMPPGTDERGIVNKQRLVRAHERQLLETDFEVTNNWTRRTVGNTSTTLQLNEETHVLVDDDARRAAVVRRELDREDERLRNQTISLYVDGETVFRKTVAPSVEYARYNSSFDAGQRAVGSDRIDRYLGDGRWEPVESRTVHGREVIVFEHDPETEAGPRGVNASGRIAIDSRGVVHEFSYRERRQEGAGHERTVYTFDIDPTIDVTVDSPDWLDEAKNATSTVTPSTATTTSG